MAHKRPRALCKSRPIPNGEDTLLRPPAPFDSDTDDDESRSSHSSTKRLRLTYKQNGDDIIDYELRETTPYVVHSQPPISPPLTTQQLEKTTCDLEDWEDLKELFARAVVSYDNDDVHEALPLLRSVINECTRFLHYYSDPSIVFTERPRRVSKSPETFTPPEERFRRDWDCEMASGSLSPPSRPPSRSQKNGHRQQTDLPTAFHTIYGTSLFYIGTILSHSPSLAHPDEPQHSAISYYLAALDVFEAGENLPSKLDAQYGGAEIKEDWRMAIAWGRTLVNIAEEKVMERKLPAAPVCFSLRGVIGRWGGGVRWLRRALLMING